MAILLKSRKNLLDMVPLPEPAINWTQTEAGLVQLVVPRNGIVDRLVRPFAHTPHSLRVDLDAYGSTVWLAINGQRDLYAIGQLVRKTHGAEAEPLYERLGAFINLLKNNRLIRCLHPTRPTAGR